LFLRNNQFYISNEVQQIMPWWNRQKFNKENVSKVGNGGGIYTFYDQFGQPIYVGRASGSEYGGLKHRVSSYHQKDCFEEHPTKRALRKEIDSFSVDYVDDKKQRRALEKRKKQGMRHNHS